MRIANSKIIDSGVGSGGYAGWKVEIDNTEFINVDVAVTGADKMIRDSIFTGSNIAINASRIDVYRSHFENNGTAIRGDGGVVIDNVIINNTIGIENSQYAFSRISGNTITANDKGIVLSRNSSSGTIEHNNIYENTTYNIENTGQYDKDVSNNYFGSVDNCTIEDKLFDVMDDNNKGLVSYSPVLSALYDGQSEPQTQAISRCPDNVTFHPA